MLHVRVAGKLDFSLPLRQVLDRGQQVFDPARKVERGVAQIQSQCRQYLVVTRAAEVQASAGFADVVCQPRFKRGVHVLVLER